MGIGKLLSGKSFKTPKQVAGIPIPSVFLKKPLKVAGSAAKFTKDSIRHIKDHPLKGVLAPVLAAPYAAARATKVGLHPPNLSKNISTLATRGPHAALGSLANQVANDYVENPALNPVRTPVQKPSPNPTLSIKAPSPSDQL